MGKWVGLGSSALSSAGSGVVFRTSLRTLGEEVHRALCLRL